MAGSRQVLELAMSNHDVAELTTVSRSRTESASRVERARMLLAYRETPSFYAYVRMLDAEAAGADWREVSKIVLRIDPEREPGRALASLSGSQPQRVGSPGA